MTGECRITSWQQAYKTYDVVVCIDSIFLDALMTKQIALSDVDLVIFDEAHNAVGESKYTKYTVMWVYEGCPNYFEF